MYLEIHPQSKTMSMVCIKKSGITDIFVLVTTGLSLTPS